jgi:glycosyltransferase involved in cell wall biosynthesis
MMELTILMPCLNEAETLAVCIGKAQKFITENNIDGEVLIADNGSTDNSVALAQSLGARVVGAHEKGYGSALQAGINAAQGKFVIMGDADDSYDFYPLMPFVEKLREGFDLVMGNRFKGGIKKGAMPWLHRYLGNPVLSFIGRLFFKSAIKDFHCGLRGFSKKRILDLSLTTPGMEFASEMVVKATILDYKMAEVPIVLHPDGRSHAPHLNTWRDGWRHLVFLLIYSPRWLFFFPSLFFLFLSLAALFVLLPGTLNLTAFSLDIHTLTLAGATTVLSWQLFLFALFIRLFSINQGLFPARKKHLRFLDAFSLERGIGVGMVFFMAGLILLIILFSNWAHLNYGPLNDVSSTFRILVPALTLISLGVQTVFASFFVRILNLKPKTQYQNEMAR